MHHDFGKKNWTFHPLSICIFDACVYLYFMKLLPKLNCSNSMNIGIHNHKKKRYLYLSSPWNKIQIGLKGWVMFSIFKSFILSKPSPNRYASHSGSVSCFVRLVTFAQPRPVCRWASVDLRAGSALPGNLSSRWAALSPLCHRDSPRYNAAYRDVDMVRYWR